MHLNGIVRQVSMPMPHCAQDGTRAASSVWHVAQRSSEFQISNLLARHDTLVSRRHAALHPAPGRRSSWCGACASTLHPSSSPSRCSATSAGSR